MPLRWIFLRSKCSRRVMAGALRTRVAAGMFTLSALVRFVHTDADMDACVGT